jgi:hypothetical protein
MKTQTDKELKEIVDKVLPEIEKRFVSNADKRNLANFLIAAGFGTKKRFIYLLIESANEINIGEGMPEPSELEALMYSVRSKAKPKPNYELNEEMVSAGKKFALVSVKIFFNKFHLDYSEVIELNDTVHTVLASIAQNEGEDPQAISNFINDQGLSIKDALKYSKTTADLTKEAKMKSQRYNVLYEISKANFLFNITYNEVVILANSYNQNHPSVRLAGELIKLENVSKLKIFSITNIKAFENERELSARLYPGIKKIADIGSWSYDKFSQFGEDLTSLFLNPIPTIDIPILSENWNNTIRHPDSFQNVPPHIIGLYNEVCQTFINKNNLLCAGGIRAILEAICIDKNVKEGTVPGSTTGKKNASLKGRIYGLCENDIITKQHSDILVHHQYLGDKALHECEKPTQSELETAIDIIGHTLSSVYDLYLKGQELIQKKNSRINGS